MSVILAGGPALPESLQEDSFHAHACTPVSWWPGDKNHFP
jgi:hypothetical protein